MHSILIKFVVFICLLIVSTVSNSEPNDIDSEQPPAEKKITDVDDVTEVIGFDEDEVIDYHITRREHPDNPCDRGLDSQPYEKSWYDDSQIYINSKFCEPALWFDNFFAADRLIDEGIAGSYVRWRNDFSFDEVDRFEYKPRVSFSFQLPGFKKRLRLTFEGDQDDDLRDIAPRNNVNTDNSLNLQLDLKKSGRSKFSVRVNLTPRVRFRYRYTYPVYENIILRLTQEVQWRDGVNSAKTRFDYEQELSTKFLFRSSTEAIFSEVFDGSDWLQAFVLYQWVNKRFSIAYETSVNGVTEPIDKVLDYRVGVRFRKNFHREWLFFEVVPEVTWPIEFDVQRFNVVTDRHSKWRLLFRMEVHFGNATRKRYENYNRL